MTIKFFSSKTLLSGVILASPPGAKRGGTHAGMTQGGMSGGRP